MNYWDCKGRIFINVFMKWHMYVMTCLICLLKMNTIMKLFLWTLTSYRQEEYISSNTENLNIELKNIISKNGRCFDKSLLNVTKLEKNVWQMIHNK